MKRLLLIGCIFSAGAWGAEDVVPAAKSKREFHIFHATPRELLRELSADRPDTTESPHTVDAGWFQIEMDVLSYTRDRHNTARADERVDRWSWATINFKAGLWHDTDLQIIAPTFNEERVENRAAGTSERSRGIGDLTLRWKRNLWGNDEGVTALAVMPFVKIPTSNRGLGNGAVEGGVIVPLGVNLGRGWSLGVMAELDVLKNANSSGYHPELLNSIALSHAVSGDLGAFLEFVSIMSAERGASWVATVNTGLTYTVSDDLQFDAGVAVGLTRAADDLNPFMGVTWRF